MMSTAPQAQDVHHFRVGEIRCTVLNDEVYPTLSADFLFSNAPEEELRESLERWRLEPSAVRLPVLLLLIRTGDAVVLVDTGYGSLENGRLFPTGRSVSRMEEVGVLPEEVDHVILTHGHGDHIGGILDQDGGVRFSGARYLMATAEWEASISIPELRPSLERIEPQVELVEPTEEGLEVVEGIGLLATPGHTPGHMCVTVRSGGEELISTGDVFAHPIHIEHPEWHMGHEMDPTLVLDSRRRILQRATANGSLLHVPHFDFPGLGRVAKAGSTWRWQPLAERDVS